MSEDNHDGEPCEVCGDAVCVPLRVTAVAGTPVPLQPYYMVKADSEGSLYNNDLRAANIVLEEPGATARQWAAKEDPEVYTEEELEAFETRNENAAMVVECIVFCKQCWDKTQAGVKENRRDSEKEAKLLFDASIEAQLVRQVPDDNAQEKFEVEQMSKKRLQEEVVEEEEQKKKKKKTTITKTTKTTKAAKTAKATKKAKK